MLLKILNVATTTKEIYHYNDDDGGADDDEEKEVHLLYKNRDAMRLSIEVAFIKIDIICPTHPLHTLKCWPRTRDESSGHHRNLKYMPKGD